MQIVLIRSSNGQWLIKDTIMSLRAVPAGYMLYCHSEQTSSPTVRWMWDNDFHETVFPRLRDARNWIAACDDPPTIQWSNRYPPCQRVDSGRWICGDGSIERIDNIYYVHYPNNGVHRFHRLDEARFQLKRMHTFTAGC